MATGSGARPASFDLAPMSPLIAGLTVLLFLLPVVFTVAAFAWAAPLAIPAGILVALYTWVWLRFRPSRFVVGADGVSIVWPLKRARIPLSDIASARVLDRPELKAEIGWGLRVGAGGLWGGFGRLQTGNRGSLHLFVSRLDRFVWIECRDDRPWLITPERPEDFIGALTAAITEGKGGD